MEPYNIEMPPAEVLNALAIAFGLCSVIKIVCDLLQCTSGSTSQILDVLNDLTNEVKELKELVGNLQNSDLLTVIDSSDEQEEESSEIEGNQIIEASSEEQPQTADLDKHAILCSKLTPNQELFVSYKKTTFLAKFELKESAPHGYVLKYNNTEYVTPSQFSFKLKKTLNPAISSDNGWDTVYIITGHTDKGKPIKKSLKELIA